MVFNSNVCTSTEKIWYGDIDVTIEEEKLVRLAKELGETIFLLYEGDCRFEDEENPPIEKAIIHVFPSGMVALNADLEELYTKEGSRMVRIIKEKEPEPELPDNADNDYNENEFINKVKLPNLKTFKSLKKDKLCPYMKLWEFVAKELKMEIKDVFVGGLVINTHTETVLDGYLEDWVRKNHKDLTEYKIKKAIMWHKFDVGPNVFQNSKFGPSWSEKDCVYTKENIEARKNGGKNA